MATDLESLRAEIDSCLQKSSLATFYGFATFSESETIYWDVARHPDFRFFLQSAEKAGVRLVVFNQEQFSLDEIDSGTEQLEESNLSREDKRSIENRIRELQKFEGFTARLELSFCLENRNYVFQIQADWYRDWDDLMSQIEAAADDTEDLGDDSLSGYFSAN